MMMMMIIWKCIFVGKDGITKWEKSISKKNLKTRAQNIIKHFPGVKVAAKGLKTEIAIWKYFFTNDILNLIVHYTNKHIQSARSNYSRERDGKDTDILEIQAVIGLLYLAGVLKLNRLSLEELWANNATGVELFRLTMSQSRFRFLLAHLRFDDLETRDERKKIDKLAAVREVFDTVVNNFKTAYTPFEFVTIDEKLEAFRGKCNFRQYIPSKPNKYGIKIIALADSKTFYTSNMEVYVGKQLSGPYECSNLPTAVVQRLCEPIKGTSRNVTVDNWFTSMDLLTSLYEDFKLTLLGTVRKNKRQLPLEFPQPSRRPVGSSLFAFRSNCTLVSHVPKKNKNILVL
ncbi:piggyBac transposable element-derived protein 4-like [Anthonomus grandis grandis]|uniref:piggyBac transposable element-derived protein 4-like n=1 Tax=Anthonomus grandis grandis TaxID=2921223 RepID=UPI002165028D|nr:piggyBac transposable element-derived protein 4-like [Anthonomus grandis grandis]